MQLTISHALTISIFALVVGACTELELEPPDPPSADVCNVVADRVVDCPAPALPPCPPWWPACPDGALRAAECRIACASWTCAGSTVDECRADCEAYRFERYCPEVA